MYVAKGDILIGGLTELECSLESSLHETIEEII